MKMLQMTQIRLQIFSKSHPKKYEGCRGAAIRAVLPILTDFGGIPLIPEYDLIKDLDELRIDGSRVNNHHSHCVNRCI